jgi:hypothetical protein
MMNRLLQSIPSPPKIREELERMVVRDRLGPVGGPEEKTDDPDLFGDEDCVRKSCSTADAVVQTGANRVWSGLSSQRWRVF